MLPISISLVNCSSGYSFEIRIFGLHFLEHALISRWNAFSAQEQVDFRQAIISLLLDGLASSASEKRALKEKMAGLIVSIALRTWPQNWPDFRSFLSQLFSTGRLTLIEVGLMIIRSLAEDIFMYDLKHIEGPRLHELKAALTLEAPFLLSMVAEYTKSLSLVLQEKSGDVSVNEFVFTEAIQVWSPYIDWIPFQ